MLIFFKTVVLTTSKNTVGHYLARLQLSRVDQLRLNGLLKVLS